MLAYMAVTAHDADRPRFWGGREALALSMGRPVADKKTEDPEEQAHRRRAFKAVDRMLATLKDEGAITQMKPASPGHNAVYALNLDAERTPLIGDRPKGKRTPVAGERKGPKGPKNRPAKDRNGPRLVDTTHPGYWGECTPITDLTDPGDRGPEEYQEEVGLKVGEEMAEVSPTSHPPRATAGDPPPDNVVKLPLRRTTRAADAIAEAMARRAAAVAAHQATKEAN
jgi:hypothetical protein